MKDVWLCYVVDVNIEVVHKFAVRYGVKVVSECEVFVDCEVGVVLIVFFIDIYVCFVIVVVRVGKVIFCEKLIDFSLKKVDDCLVEVEKVGVLMFVGFNRCFDLSFVVLKKCFDVGEIGVVE